MTAEASREVPLGDLGPQRGAPGEGAPKRDKWANKMEFLFVMAGEIIGLGNVWRFPYLCFRNGGGAFLIPYFVVLLFCGFPLFFMETALGQFTSEGGVTAWRKICPMFEGVGMASQIILLYVSIYRTVVLAWILFYLFNSFRSPLPWATCDNWWNTGKAIYANPHMFQPDSNWSFLHNTTPSGDYTDDYFDVIRVLRMTDQMSLINVHWQVAACLLVAWIMCYFCVWKGVKSTGKVAYFTATFPYLLLFILFIRAVTLPGAADGLKYYLMPDFSRIADPRVWSDAANHVFISFAVCQGVLTALGSYNKYNNNCFKDCVTLVCLNSATSIFAGFVVFSVLGFMSYEMNVSIEEVASAGFDLCFMVLPKALSLLPGFSFWAVLFFLMCLFLDLDSQFVLVESLATNITDMFPHFLRRPGRREKLVLVIAAFCYLLGLVFVTEGGITLFYMFDHYGAGHISLRFIACFETVVIAWVYGANRFYDNIEDMIGYQPFPLLKYCWLFVIPLVCWMTLVYDLNNSHIVGVYGYEPGSWMFILGGLLMLIPLMCIPVYINPQNMTTPSSDLRQAWPHKPVLTLCNHVIFKGQAKPPRTAGERDEKMMMETSGV
uniref:Transporter n=1 Tax=Myripristis murdjan TaxID=586833 RepID=A0A668A5E4_9TELE